MTYTVNYIILACRYKNGEAIEEEINGSQSKVDQK